jgi:hypothetical protein
MSTTRSAAEHDQVCQAVCLLVVSGADSLLSDHVSCRTSLCACWCHADQVTASIIVQAPLAHVCSSSAHQAYRTPHTQR